MHSRKICKWNVFIFLSVISILCYHWNYFKDNKSKSFVILSSNFNHRYLFLLPFTVSLWKRLGIEAVVIFVGDERVFLGNHQSRNTIKILKEMNAKVFYYQPVHLSTTSLSQIIRLFGAVLPPLQNVSDESIIITSDADLAVFKLANHIPNLNNGKTIHLYNSNCCGSINVPLMKGNFQVKMFPMGTIAATKKTWRDIMGYNAKVFSIDAIEKYLIDEFGGKFFHPNDDTNVTLVGSSIWYADQSLFSYKFDLWVKKFRNKNFVTYHPEVPKRIDRIKWPTAKNFSQLNIEDFDDAHLPVSVYSKNEWNKFLPFLRFAFNNDALLIKKFIQYRKSFCKFNIC